MNVEVLIREVLVDRLDPAVGVGTDFPVDGRTPFVFFRVTGGSSIDPDVMDQAIVEFQIIGSSKSAACDLALAVRSGLRSALLDRFHTSVGSLAHVTENVRPTPLSVGLAEPDGVSRYRANYTLRLKPLPV